MPPPTRTRVLDVLLAYLKAEGVRHVFGIPGGLLYPFFDAVEKNADFQLVVSKHEEGAAFMADGYARTSGRLAVCGGTAGPGATNLLTGVSCAFADGVPMLVITGQVASHALGKGAAQETSREDMDIVAMFRPVTKYSAMVTHPQSVSLHLRRALRLALTGRPGPVHLNFPVDLWEQPLVETWFDPQTYRPSTRVFDRSAVQIATDILLGAAHPVILAGSGIAVAGAEQQLLALAQVLPALVATSPRAKGVFPEDHPLSLGILGTAGHESARSVLLGTTVDVLLTAGASLNETTTLNWNEALTASRSLLQLDIDADRIGRNYPVNVPLVGDAQTVLVEILYHVHRKIRDGAEVGSLWPRGSAASARPDHSHYMTPELRVSDARPLAPPRWRCELMDVLPADTLIFSDIGGHMLFNLHHLCIRRGQRFFINLGFGSMGHGTVAPIGAALANPTRPVLAIVGDACFTMNGMELLTASEHGAKVVWIVENNNMHGITWHASNALSRGRPLESIRYRQPVEVAAMARAMGLPAWIVDGPGQLQDIVKRAFESPGPAVIEVRVDGTIPPPMGERTRSLAGFIEERTQ